MQLAELVATARKRVREARTVLTREIARKEAELQQLRAAMAELGAPVAKQARNKPRRGGETPATKALGKLAKSFTLEQAKKAGLRGVGLAQLARRGLIKKTGDGEYERRAA